MVQNLFLLKKYTFNNLEIFTFLRRLLVFRFAHQLIVHLHCRFSVNWINPFSIVVGIFCYRSKMSSKCWCWQEKREAPTKSTCLDDHVTYFLPDLNKHKVHMQSFHKHPRESGGGKEVKKCSSLEETGC